MLELLVVVFVVAVATSAVVLAWRVRRAREEVTRLDALRYLTKGPRPRRRLEDARPAPGALTLARRPFVAPAGVCADLSD